MKKLISLIASVIFCLNVFAQDTLPPRLKGTIKDTFPPQPVMPDTTTKKEWNNNDTSKKNWQKDNTGTELNTPGVPAVTEKKEMANNNEDTKQEMEDRVMMKENKMVIIKNGEEMSMKKDIKISNGTTVMTDGTVKMASGKIMKLKNGQYLSLKNKTFDAAPGKKG